MVYSCPKVHLLVGLFCFIYFASKETWSNETRKTIAIGPVHTGCSLMYTAPAFAFYQRAPEARSQGYMVE